MKKTIMGKLERAFAPVEVEVVDESHLHIGHAGYREGGNSHFAVRIRAAAFDGVSRVQAQRLVYKVLAEELDAGLHALRLDVAGLVISD